MNEPKVKRELDGFFLRVKRGDHYEAVCFTDLTDEEQKNWLDRLFGEGLRSMVKVFCENIIIMSQMDLTDEELRYMAKTTADMLRVFGDNFGITQNDTGDE